MRGAGTDANVTFELIGDKASSGAQRVNAGVEAFDRGNADEFHYTLKHLGTLQKLVVQHDNAGGNAAWFLSRVEVVCSKDGIPITFPCDRWLASQDPNIHPQVELVPGVGGGVRCYRLEVKTSDQRGSGTDSGVSVVLVGNAGMTVGPIKLDRKGAFECGQVSLMIGHGSGMLCLGMMRYRSCYRFCLTVFDGDSV